MPGDQQQLLQALHTDAFQIPYVGSCAKLLLTFCRVRKDVDGAFCAISCLWLGFCLLWLCAGAGTRTGAAEGTCCLLLLPVLYLSRRAWLPHASNEPSYSYLDADEDREWETHYKLQQTEQHLSHHFLDTKSHAFEQLSHKRQLLGISHYA
jgi:hypothetical protein